MNIKLSLILLALAQIACITTGANAATIQPEPTYANTATPVSMQTEEPAGAVFEISEQVQQCARVNANALHLRTNANEQSQVITWLDHGETVRVLAKGAEWWTIQAGTRTGFARALYLTEVDCP